MAPPATDVVGEFRAALDTLTRYPTLLLPPLAVGALGFALLVLLGGGVAVMGAVMGALLGGGEGAAAGGLVGLLAGVAVFVVVTGLLAVVASGVVVVMAREALAGREPGLGAATWVVLGQLGPLIVASGLSALAIGVGFLFFVVPGLVAAVCLLFTMPAVLLDGRGPVQAMRRSVAIVRAHPGPVVGFVAGAVIVATGAALAGWVAGIIPFVGGLASLVLHVAVMSYLTLVAVRIYQGHPVP